MFCIDERAAPLGAVAHEGSVFEYQYDFGDDWYHDVLVERVSDQGDETIRCTGGGCACPPEDCGGPPGYERMLAALADPDHEEHAEMKEWAPRGFNAAKFDPATVNKRLVALSKRLAKRRR
jgi:pRiA4b ORF-3-like protein